MSHYAIAKVKIRNPDRKVLVKALEAIAQKLGGKVAENVTVRGFNFTKKCDLAILMELPWGNGYGIEITPKGEIVVHVDDHGAPMTAEEFAEELNREYTTAAITEVLNQEGYATNVVRQEGKNVIYAYEAW